MTDPIDYIPKKYRPVIGSTMINHGPRTRLDLSMEEYALAVLIEYCNDNKKELDEYRVRLHIGLHPDEFIKCLNKLIELDIVYWKEGNNKYPVLSEKWIEIHMKATDAEFESFWAKEMGIRWPGSKSESKAKFERLREEVSFAYIMAQKRAYFKLLCHPKMSYRQVMGGPVFLNRNTKRFAEPWGKYLEDLKAGRGIGEKEEKKTSKMTIEDHKNRFK